MSPLGNKRSLFRRVFGTIFGVVLLVVVVLTLVGAVYLQNKIAEISRSELYDEAQIIASMLNETDDDVSLLDRLVLDEVRVTLVDADGSVMFDTTRNRPHRWRTTTAVRRSSRRARREPAIPSVRAQRSARFCSTRQCCSTTVWWFASRRSRTVCSPVVGLVCRAAARPRGDSARDLIFRRAPAPRTGSSRRCSRVDLDHPKHKTPRRMYSEMTPMLDRIESQRQELKQQMRVLADNDRMRREFTAKHHRMS